MDASDPWTDLSHFTTFDLVSRDFFRRHGKQPSEAHAWQILSSFVQARSYFESGHDAREDVRPLLIYYGILSLARGAILVMERSFDKATSRGHGLTAEKWDEVFARGGFMQMSVKVAGGTFSDLVRTVAELKAKPTAGALPGQMVIPLPLPPAPPLGASLSLDDLMSRTPELTAVYEKVTAQRANVDHGAVYAGKSTVAVSTNFTEADLEGTEVGESPKFAPLRERYAIPPNEKIHLGTSGFSHRPCASFRLSREQDDKYPRGCAVQENSDINSQGDLILPFHDGSYLPPVARCFASAYFLGMLVRYFPAKWIALLRNKPGDAYLPLLQRALAHTAREFPQLILALLNDDPGKSAQASSLFPRISLD